jgi:hypothetical protein
VTDPILEHLVVNGPSTSSSLLRMLEDQGISPEAARKRLSRLPDSICRIKGCGLPQNQQLIFMSEDYMSARFKDALLTAWKSGKSVHANALALLNAAPEYVPKEQFYVRCGAPLAMKKQVTISKLLEQLERFRFIQRRSIPELGETIVSFDAGTFKTEQIARARAVLLAEKLAIQALPLPLIERRPIVRARIDPVVKGDFWFSSCG